MTTTILLLLATLAPGQLEQLDNIAVNPSFELDNDRDDLPDGWKGMAFDSPAKLHWDSRRGDDRASAAYEFPIHSAQGDQRDWKQCTGRWFSSPRPIVPGSQYTLEVWIKTEDVTGQAYAHLAWQQGSRWLSEDATSRLSGTGDWQKVTLTATAPEKADSLVVSMNLARSRERPGSTISACRAQSEMPAEVEYVFNDTSDWFPFEFPLDDTNLDTHRPDRFARRAGRKHVALSPSRDDGHFYFEDGSRARFFGTNVGGC